MHLFELPLELSVPQLPNAYLIYESVAEVGEHETQLFELPPELSDPQKTPCVNVPEWFVREGGELCLSESGNGTSVIRWDYTASLFRTRSFWASRIRHYCYGSGSSHQQAKTIRKPLISTVL
jgi:hypothetical protein